jgi:lysophospholipid acyltransferase (LPLAT)-like uncharacterized protein
VKLRNPVLVRAVARLVSWTVRGWVGTLRLHCHGLDPAIDPRRGDNPGRYICAFWHESLLVPLGSFGRSDRHVLISRHADGELVATAAEYLGFTTIRGSSTRGGAEAVRRIVRLGGRGDVAVTPDGPRGPRRRVQPGLVYLAARTGLPVLPMGVGLDRPWRARSWDRFALPRPFSRAIVVTGVPLAVPPGGEQDAEHHRRRIEEALHYVTELAERIATTGQRASVPRLSAVRRAA